MVRFLWALLVPSFIGDIKQFKQMYFYACFFCFFACMDCLYGIAFWSNKLKTKTQDKIFSILALKCEHEVIQIELLNLK